MLVAAGKVRVGEVDVKKLTREPVVHLRYIKPLASTWLVASLTSTMPYT